ncbi:MAG: hypothetical protein A2Y56_14905 [Candidatus Aminicenantes bacterium RBG_13_63_10]|nr:MAG: hypothetical protein A2Y56_14905 [Candidatus Aminicenantes bacterium RBG_13_63_10]
MRGHRGAIGLAVLLSLVISSGQTAARPDAQTRTPDPALSRPTLSAEDKVEITQALRLKKETGDLIWPGLAGADIPIVLYNAVYEFLVGYESPPQPWEQVASDDVQGAKYFRRARQNPQSFAAKIGERWAGSIASLDLMQSKVPLKLGRDLHAVFLLHEMFHAFQATQAPKRFERALAAYKSESRYPFQEAEFAADWTEEGATLAQALKAANDALARRLAGKFLEIRRMRRGRSGLAPELVTYERELEWLEGLAKQAEMKFYEIAGARLPFILQNDFVRLEKQMGAQGGDLRFYLSGMAQARLLDRLCPGWQSKTALAALILEDILSAVVTPKPDE